MQSKTYVVLLKPCREALEPEAKVLAGGFIGCKIHFNGCRLEDRARRSGHRDEEMVEVRHVDEAVSVACTSAFLLAYACKVADF